MRALRGCWWWTVTLFTAGVVIALMFMYPWLFIVAAVLLGLGVIALVVPSTKLRRPKK